MEEKRNRKKPGVLYRVIMIILICIIAFCIYKIANIISEYRAGTEVYDELAELAEAVPEETAPENQETDETTAGDETTTPTEDTDAGDATTNGDSTTGDEATDSDTTTDGDTAANGEETDSTVAAEEPETAETTNAG